MPATKLQKKVAKEKKKQEDPGDAALRKIIKGYLGQYRMPCKALAPEIGVSESTMYKRIACPEKFTRREIKLIFRILQVSEEDKRTIPW